MGRNRLTINTNTNIHTQKELRRTRQIRSPRTPVPKTPHPWIWICHKCRRSYPFKATARCLSCSHRFCGKCVSELDYTAWRVYDAYWSQRAGATATSATRLHCVWLTEEDDMERSSLEHARIFTVHEEGRDIYSYKTLIGKDEGNESNNLTEQKPLSLDWNIADYSGLEHKINLEDSIVDHENEPKDTAARTPSCSASSIAISPRSYRKKSLTIITSAVAEDIALNSAGQEMNSWDSLLPSKSYSLSPYTPHGTDSFFWEGSLFDETSKESNGLEPEPGYGGGE